MAKEVTSTISYNIFRTNAVPATFVFPLVLT